MSNNYFIQKYGGRPAPVIAAPTNPYQVQQAAADVAAKTTGTAKTAEEIRGVQLKNQADAQQLRNYPISREDAAIIDRYRQQADIASNAQIELLQSAKASDRFQPSPERAANVAKSLIKEDDSLFTQLGRKGYAWLQGVSPQDIQDYQDLDRYRQARVATIQQQQAGPQTESDAARYMKSTFGPDKSTPINRSAIAEAMFNAKFDELRPGMYTQWANKYGSLSARNKDGLTVDDWYNRARADGWNRFQRRQSGLSVTDGAPRKAPAVPSDVQAILNKYGVR